MPKGKPKPSVDEGPLVCKGEGCKEPPIKYCKVCDTPVCLRHTKSCPGCAMRRRLKKVCHKDYLKRYKVNAWVSKLPGDQWLIYIWMFVFVAVATVTTDEQSSNPLIVVSGGIIVLVLWCCFRKKYDDFEEDWFDSKSHARLSLIATGGETNNVPLNITTVPRTKKGVLSRLVENLWPQLNDDDEDEDEDDAILSKKVGENRHKLNGTHTEENN